MEIFSDFAGVIWNLLNETIGHQAANAFNALMWALGVYTD